MFGYIKKLVRGVKAPSQREEENSEEYNKQRLTASLSSNLKQIGAVMGSSCDVKTREFTIGNMRKTEAALIFLDGLIDLTMINENIIRPLMYDVHLLDEKEDEDAARNIGALSKSLVSVGEVTQADKLTDVISGCLCGDTVLLVDGFRYALIINARGGERRAVEDPETDSVIRGPREGFTENARTNTSLIRKRIKSPALKVESMVIGKQTNTLVFLIYISNIADDRLVREARSRLQNIRIDSVLDSGYVEQYIEDSPCSIFPQLGNTEKPDVVAAKLLEGRVAILVDGSPFVLTAPMLFIESFQAAEDYYSRPYFSSFLRLLRFISFGLSVLAPALYVALTTFHQELIPTSLLFTMAASREGIPFPAVVEAFGMMIIFEILREAGIRLPRPVGQAISIVGALVIGESAVSAGLVGAPMVIVVAVTAVSSFVVPTQYDSGAIIRVFLLLMAGTMGGFGITMGILIILIHLSSLKSFGVHYSLPASPVSPSGLKDSLVRFPLWTMFTRPLGLARGNRQRRPAQISKAQKNDH